MCLGTKEMGGDLGAVERAELTVKERQREGSPRTFWNCKSARFKSHMCFQSF